MASEKDTRIKTMTEGLKKPAGKFRSMTIDAADNGYSVRTHREMPAKAKDDNDGDEGTAPQAMMAASGSDGMSNTVHPDAESVIEHVRRHMGK